jgi:general secretion pathway protein B
MSYILDALRRADAERERGAVPGLHTANLASPVGPSSLRPPSSGSGIASRWWLLLAALLVLALLGAGWWLGRSGAPGAVLVQTQPARAPGVPLDGQGGWAPPPAAAGTATATEATTPSPPMVVVMAPPPAPSTSPPPAAPPAPAPAPATPALPTAAPAVAAPVPLAQLTPEQRQAFPPLTLGGSIWSESAANRFVIANGQVVREGELAAPGVTVERIEPRAAILRWRDLRVELPL